MNPSTAEPAYSWASWRLAVFLAVAVTLLRLAYLLSISPYELVGDEAQYWVWSQRLDWSYYSKGPGVAWTIAAFTGLLGHSEWAVRLPAVLWSLAATLAVGRLAIRLAGDPRAGFFAVAAMCLLPAFQAVALLMTIDSPYLACWALALLAGWHVLDDLEHRRSRLLPWLALAAFLGLGFLYKYTMLTMLPGLLAVLLLRRRAIAWSWRSALYALLALLLLLACLSPVLIWNQRHGWPTFGHLTGQDWALSTAQPRPFWMHLLGPLEYLGQQIAMVGPMIVAMILGIIHAIYNRWKEARLWPGRLMTLCACGSLLLFYLAVSFTRSTEANWAIASYTGLVALLAAIAAPEMTRYRRLLHDWLAKPGKPATRPRQGFFRRKPETLFQVAWHWSIAVGLATGLGMLVLPWIAPLIPGNLVPTARFSGWRNRAAIIADTLSRQPAWPPPFLITDNYAIASLMSFYIPGHPTVYSASSLLGPGGRRSSHDFFPDTNLRSASVQETLAGRPAIILDDSSQRWTDHFRFASPPQLLVYLDPPPTGAATQPATQARQRPALKLFLAPGYQGPKDVDSRKR